MSDATDFDADTKHTSSLLGGAIAKLDELCAQGRYGDAHRLSQDLDFGLRQKPRAKGGGEPITRRNVLEGELAAVLSNLLTDGSYWRDFSRPGDITVDTARAKSVHLYLVSEPWALASAASLWSGSRHEPADYAAAIIREIADGYAMLSGRWTESQRQQLRLPRPTASSLQNLFREFSIDDWLSDHGHRMTPVAELGDDTAPGPPISAEPAVIAGYVVHQFFLLDFVTSVLKVGSGFAALQRNSFAALSSAYVAYARNVEASLSAQQPDGPTGAILVCHVIARAFFLATHGQSGAAAFDPVASTNLREILEDTSALEWLTDQDLPWPRWLSG